MLLKPFFTVRVSLLFLQKVNFRSRVPLSKPMITVPLVSSERPAPPDREPRELVFVSSSWPMLSRFAIPRSKMFFQDIAYFLKELKKVYY